MVLVRVQLVLCSTSCADLAQRTLGSVQGVVPKRARRTTGHVAKGLAVADPDAPLLGVDPADHLGQPHEALRPGPPTRPGSRADSHAGPADDDMTNKEATLPLPVDTVIRTKWLDGEYHLARVVSVRDRAGAVDPSDKEYYMHYVNMNRRMDTWVTAHVMDLSWHEFDGIDEKRCARCALLFASATAQHACLRLSPRHLNHACTRRATICIKMRHYARTPSAYCCALRNIVPRFPRCLLSVRQCALSILGGRS